MSDIELDKDWWKIWKNRRYILCVMSCLGLMMMYGTRINLSVAVVAMTETSDEKPEPEFKWTSVQKGHLLSAFYYGYALMQGPAGVVVKYVPPHILYGTAVFGSALLTALIPSIAHYYYVLLIFRIAMGAFQAAAVPTGLHFMTNWAPPLERSRMQSINISGAFLGPIWTMPISGLVGELYGWQWIFYTFTITSFVWCIVWAFCIRATPDTDKFISKRELEYIKRSIGDRTEEAKLPVPWSSLLLSVPVLCICLGNFSWGWGFQTMLAQLPSFLKDVAKFDLAKNGLLSSLPYVVMTLMFWTAGYIADLLSIKGFTTTLIRKCFMSGALIIQGIFIVIAAFIVTPGINIACIALSVGFGAFVYAVISVNPLDLAPPFSPIIAGISGMFGTSPGVISPIVAGYIVTAEKSDTDALKTQWQIVFFISAAVYVAGSIIYLWGGSGNLQPWAKGKDKKIRDANASSVP